MNTDLGGYAHSVHKCTTVGGSLSESESNEQLTNRKNKYVKPCNMQEK